jgi:hypothetical protein
MPCLGAFGAADRAAGFGRRTPACSGTTSHSIAPSLRGSCTWYWKRSSSDRHLPRGKRWLQAPCGRRGRSIAGRSPDSCPNALEADRLVCSREPTDTGLAAKVGLAVRSETQGLQREESSTRQLELVDTRLEGASLGCLEGFTEGNDKEQENGKVVLTRAVDQRIGTRHSRSTDQ